MRRAQKSIATCLVAMVMLFVGGIASGAAEMTSEAFDTEPEGWEGVNNWGELKKSVAVKQDFGLSETKFASSAAGEVGGLLTRAARPAQFAAGMGVKTLEDALTASGTFAITKSGSGSGVFFGFFDSDQHEASGRPTSSLGLQLDGENAGARLAVRMISSSNRSCGMFITPFIPGKYRPTPIRDDGTRYTWMLKYDPAAAGGRGQFRFSIKSDRREKEKEEFEGKEFVTDLPEGFKADGARFDRLGLMNMTKPGGTMTIYFGDLVHDDVPEDAGTLSRWIGVGNREQYAAESQSGVHRFGFSKTNFAGGSIGEIGGEMWRSGPFAYYADRVQGLSAKSRLQASGRIVLMVGAPDSDAYFGWFNSAVKENGEGYMPPFIGVHIGGPTRSGHCFRPAVASGVGKIAGAEPAPALLHRKSYPWTLNYDPEARMLTATLGDQKATLQLKAGQGPGDVRLDHFGIFTSNIGGSLLRFYLDDLRYTGGRD